jgi:lipopolysaccharide heptosyltransferase II
MKKILFFKTGAIGDVLMTTPLVRSVRKHYSRANITYMTGEHAKIALKNNKNIDIIKTFDQNIIFKKEFKEIWNLIKEIKKENYSEVFILDKHFIFSLIMFLAKIKKRTGFNRRLEGVLNNRKVKYNNTKHEIEFYLDLARTNKIKTDGTDIEFFLTKKDNEFAQNLMSIYRSKKCIALINSGGNNPGEASNLRMIPDNLFKYILQKIPQEYTVFLIGGKNDYTYYKDFMISNNILNIAGKCSFSESAAILKYCNCIITTDTGPMHLASAVNTNIISLFGPTNPKRKAPLHKKSIAIWKDKEIYDPRYELYGTIPEHKKYMEKISAEDIIEIIKKF